LKLLPIIGLLYFVSPLDAIPEFPLVAVGWLDDFAVLYFCLLGFVRLCPQAVVAEHLARIRAGN